MISIDTLEVLLRSVPQYFLFGALAFLIFGWIDKKPKITMVGEILLVVVGILSLIVMLSGMIPSPETEGLVEADVKAVINMMIGLTLTSLIALVSLVIRVLRKKSVKWLVFVSFAFALFVFFQSTSLAKVKFELNRPKTETIKK